MGLRALKEEKRKEGSEWSPGAYAIIIRAERKKPARKLKSGQREGKSSKSVVRGVFQEGEILTLGNS